MTRLASGSTLAGQRLEKTLWKHFHNVQAASHVTRLASGSTLAGQRLEKNLWKHFHNIGKELLGNMSQKSGDSRDKAGARRASDRTFWVGTSGDFRYRYGRRRPGFTRESQCVLNSFQGVRGWCACVRMVGGAKISYIYSQRNPGPTIDVFSGDPKKQLEIHLFARPFVQGRAAATQHTTGNVIYGKRTQRRRRMADSIL